MHIFPNAAPSRLIDYWPDFRNGLMNFVSFPDRSELRASLRGLLIDGYIAFYIVEVDRIVIVRVLDSRRDIRTEFAQ